MKNSLNKLSLLLISASLMSGCTRPITSIVENNSNTPSSSKVEENVSSSNDKSENNTTSNVSSSSSIMPTTSVNTNPNNCDNHELEETVTKEATLIDKGVKHFKCPNCHAEFDDYFYKLDEFAFEDTTFMDDGNEHQIFISGLLPYGCSVKYENNTLKGIGSKEATAKIYDESNNLLLEKKAKINIVQNIGLPNIRIVTEDGTDPDWHSVNGERPYKNMNVSIDNCDSAYVKNNIAGEIKVRGNSTNQESVAKRAFRLKFTSKNNLLGLNNGVKEKSWVLLADFFDQSRFRNETAFTIGNSLFNYSGFYSSDFKHVTLYMNGENRGVYLLAEQQQAKKERIPINEPEDASTVKTGYLIEIDGLASQSGKINNDTHIGTHEGDPFFTTGTGSTGGMWGGWGGQGGDSINGVNIADKAYVIKTDVFGEEQVPFIRDYTNNVLKAFKGLLKGEKKQIVDENGELKDSPYDTQYETLNSYIDLDSFFRMYILQEYLKDYDVGWGSFYMYIDFSSNSKVKRLTMGAPWDFDLGLGNKQASNGGWGGSGDQGSNNNDKDIPSSGISSTKDNFLNSNEYTNGMTTFNPWLYMLSQTDFFQNMIKKYYSIFDKSNIYERVISIIAYERVAFAESFNDNHARYGKGSSGSTLMQTRQYDSHKDATDYLIKWLGERKAYLDQNWGK